MSNQNDADKRPSMYVKANGSEVEVSITGAEGETTDDIQEKAEDMLDKAVNKVNQDEGEVDKTYD